MVAEGELLCSAINANDCDTRSKFGVVCYCIHSLPDGIMRKRALVCGYCKFSTGYFKITTGYFKIATCYFKICAGYF
jgi:S-adenosylhomocysteine hydrolase